jgi:hypothetical protein
VGIPDTSVVADLLGRFQHHRLLSGDAVCGVTFGHFVETNIFGFGCPIGAISRAHPFPCPFLV